MHVYTIIGASERGRSHACLYYYRRKSWDVGETHCLRPTGRRLYVVKKHSLMRNRRVLSAVQNVEIDGKQRKGMDTNNESSEVCRHLLPVKYLIKPFDQA